MPIAQTIGNSVSLVNQERVNHKNRQRRNRPETGRRAVNSYQSAETWADSSTEFDTATGALFSATVVFNAAAEGVIFKAGSSTLGALIAVADNTLIARCGNGAAAPQDDTSRATVSVNLIPREQRVKLSVYFAVLETGQLQTTIWINGVVKARVTSVATTSTDWADSGPGGFDVVNGTLPVEPTLTSQAYGSTAAIVNELLYFQGSVASADHPSTPEIPPPGPADELAYMGFSPTNNPAAVDFSSFNSAMTPGNDAVTIQAAGTSSDGDFLIILVPSTFAVQRISPVTVPAINELAGYTQTDDVRQVEGTDFTSYVLGPLNPDLTFNRIISTVL